MFDPVTYMETLHGELIATKTDYLFSRVSGVQGVEEILEKSRRNNKFFAIDDSQDGQTFRGAGGAFFERRAYTVFILTRTAYADMDARATVMAEARAIFRNIVSRMIKEKNTIPVIDLNRIQFYEIPPAFAHGTCGIYFIFNVENAVDLTYDATAWES